MHSYLYILILYIYIDELYRLCELFSYFLVQYFCTYIYGFPTLTLYELLILYWFTNLLTGLVSLYFIHFFFKELFLGPS